MPAEPIASRCAAARSRTWRRSARSWAPAWAVFSHGCVEISRHDPDTIYLSATRYKLADYHPYLFRSSDGGRSWTEECPSLPFVLSRMLAEDTVDRRV